jgi:hypothetical protein
MSPRASPQFGYDRYLGQHRQAEMATVNFSWKF